MGTKKTNLVAERVAHDERGVAHGAAEVDQATLGEEDDVAAVGHEVAVDLGLDVDDGRGRRLDVGNVDLEIKVA